MRCKHCGAQIEDNAPQCKFCGAVYDESILNNEEETRTSEEQMQNEASDNTASESIDDTQIMESVSDSPATEETGTDQKVEDQTVEAEQDKVYGDEEISEILDENEKKRNRQKEKIKSDKKNQLEEIEKRRLNKKKRKARNKAFAVMAIAICIIAAAAGGYQIWKHSDNGQEVVISTPAPTEAQSEEAEPTEAAETPAQSGETETAQSNSDSSNSASNWTATSGSTIGSKASTGTGSTNTKPSGSGTSSSVKPQNQSTTVTVSKPTYSQGKEYSSEGSYKDNKFTGALITGKEVVKSGDKSYMSFIYNGKVYYAKISPDTTTDYIAGRPITINAFKTSEIFDGNDVYEITHITNYTDSYIFPNSGFELLTEKDLSSKTSKELLLGRNEIYARHGRKFENEEIRKYFEGCPWYKVKDSYNYDDISDLNPIERANVKTISEYEKKMSK